VLAPLEQRDAGRDALRERVIAASREAGFFAMSQPRAFGGTAVGALALTVVREALAARNLACRRWVFGPGPGVLAGAEGRLARECLEPMLRGERRMAFAFTEPRDASPTWARRAPDGGWRVTGRKSYVTGGAEADFYAVVAALEEGDEERERSTGRVLLVVERDRAGLTVSEPFESLDGSRHVALDLDGVTLPADAIVGRPGEGLPRAMRQIGDTRLALAADACGLMQWTLDFLTEHLQTPRAGGGALGDREGVRLRYADLRMEAYAARSMLYRTARLADEGENVVNEGIATKVFVTEAVGRIVDATLQLAGGDALVLGHPLERLYREVRGLRLAEGASDVLRLHLARGRLELGFGRV